MYRVLLVEDDSALRYMCARMHVWQDCGFVLAAEAVNGKQALELLENDRFDLIVTDIRMPFVDGLELLRTLRARGLDTPVVLVSSYSEFEYAREGVVLGAFDYIVKPFGESDLAAVLQRAVAVVATRGEGDSRFSLVCAAFAQAGVFVGEDGFARSLCAFLAAHMERTVTMEETAAGMGLSKDYFGKLCKAQTGLTFGALYSRVKVEHAKALLCESAYKTYEISERLGYASPDYFTRIFKEQTGQTPSQFRSVHRR